MGLTTQDPYFQKEHTKLYKILKFRVNWANIEQDTAIQKLQNLVTNVWIAGHFSGNPYISLQILKFLNGCILFLGLVRTFKLKDNLPHRERQVIKELEQNTNNNNYNNNNNNLY